MSHFTDLNELKQLKDEVRSLQRERKSGQTERERFLDHTLPTVLTPWQSGDDLFYIGGHYVPLKEMEGNVLTQGVSGSGKTLQLKPQIASAIRAVKPNSDRRVYIKDAKQDMLPFVSKLTQEQGIPLLYFCVSDSRSIVYDIARDIDGRSDKCGEAARQLIPTPPKGEPFWSQAAQTLLQAGMIKLNQIQGTKWGLHDVYNMALFALPELVAFLSDHPSGKQVAAKYLPDDRGGNTQFGFTSQLDVSLRQLEVAAAAQYYTPRNRWVSSADFLNSNAVLLIGTNSETREVTKPIVRLLFQNLVHRIMNLPDSKTRKIMMLIDELPTWGFLPKFDDLLAFTRSKGVITSLVFQDIEQLNHLYGRSIAASLAGNCYHKLLFTPASYESAEWAVKTLGQRPFRRWDFNKNFGYDGITESKSLRIEKDFPLSTGELMDLGAADPRKGSKFVLSTKWSHPCIKFMSPKEISKVQPVNANIPLRCDRPKYQCDMPSTSRDPRSLHAFMSSSFTNDQLKDEFLSDYPKGTYEYELAKQMFSMFCEMSQKYAREFNQFYGNQ